VTDLNDLFKVIAEGKKHYEETDPVGKKLKEVKDNAKVDLSALFSQLTALKEDLEKELVIAEAQHEQKIINEIATLVAEETLTEEIPAQPVIHTPEVRAAQVNADVDRYLTDKSFQQPEPDLVAKNVEDIRNKIKFLEQAIGRISAAGPGGGEVNLRWLDDVARETIVDGRWLKYDGSRKKFVFDEINPYEVIYNTTEVTTPTYTVDENDFYIGVNYAGPVTITLPTTASSGRMLIIKDEDGDAETNPITVLGNVDNDAGGFIIQINNGAIQMIYRNGWRIV
jgi:hypothetical protein